MPPNTTEATVGDNITRSLGGLGSFWKSFIGLGNFNFGWKESVVSIVEELHNNRKSKSVSALSRICSSLDDDGGGLEFSWVTVVLRIEGFSDDFRRKEKS
ncbi:ribosomal protein L5 [Sesbania bispinosa]|nr:ribosomal protein L5 [Sesbania bispinosa]